MLGLQCVIVWHNSVIKSKISLCTSRVHFIASLFWNPSYPLAMLLFSRSKLATDSLRTALWLRSSLPLRLLPTVAACFSFLQYTIAEASLYNNLHAWFKTLWVKFSRLKFLQIAKIFGQVENAEVRKPKYSVRGVNDSLVWVTPRSLTPKAEVIPPWWKWLPYDCDDAQLQNWWAVIFWIKP